MIFGRVAPHNSAQYCGTIFPRKKKNPRRWSKPVLSLVIKDRKEEERKDRTLADTLSYLNQVLERR
jgi:hypothetical protein